VNTSSPTGTFQTVTVKVALAATPTTVANSTATFANPSNLWSDLTRTQMSVTPLARTLLNQQFFKPTMRYKSGGTLIQLPISSTTTNVSNVFRGVYSAPVASFTVNTIVYNNTTKISTYTAASAATRPAVGTIIYSALTNYVSVLTTPTSTTFTVTPDAGVSSASPVACSIPPSIDLNVTTTNVVSSLLVGT